MAGVRNSGFIFIAIILCALCSASQMFGGSIKSMTGMAPAAARTQINNVLDGLSGLLCCAGTTIFLLAFFASPGRG